MFVIILLSVFGLVGCKSSQNGDRNTAIWQTEGKLRVVATTTMLADLVREVGGEEIELIQLMDHRVDPHGYVQTHKDTQALKSADLIFYNGLHLEAKIQRALTHRSNLGGSVIAVGSLMPEDLLLNAAGERDPHIWGDPKLWVFVIDVVEKSLIQAGVKHADVFRANGENYRKSLIELDRWAQKRVEEIPETQRVLVTSHDAFQYFARSYGFEVQGLQGLSSDVEAGINSAVSLAEFVKEKGIKTIFAETTTNAKGIQSIAKEAGVLVSDIELFSDACGELGKIETSNGESYDVGTYIGMMKHNVNTVVDALATEEK